jgi:hypothetical protein
VNDWLSGEQRARQNAHTDWGKGMPIQTPSHALMRSAWTRRRVIGALGAAALASSLRAQATPPPLPDCAGSGSSPHQRIDAHLHVFNGTDLQVAGFLSTSVANEYPKFKKILKALASPLQHFVWAFSPKAVDELHHLNSLIGVGRPQDLAPATLAAAIDHDRAETDEQFAQFLYQQLQRKRVRDDMAKMIPVHHGDETGLRPRLQKAPRSSAEARALTVDFDQALGIPFFDYLKPYFSYRYVNFFEALDAFTCHADHPIDTFVALMVDFDQPLAHGARTKSLIPDQCKVMSKICELARGRLLVLAPYCPLKDANQHGASLKNVQAAWKLPGFAGAKMYPPMGFAPFGNANPHVNDALAALYHECIREDAVVLAHAGSSLCIDNSPCQTPGPPGWAAALDHVWNTEKAPLRASLGHFGGPLDKNPSPTAHDWPQKFMAMMEKQSGQRLYADLAYADAVLDPSYDQHCINTLQGLLKGSVLSERLMYSTDWLMLGLEAQWRTYLARMETVIHGAQQASGIANLEDRFFRTNARAWLGLDSAGSLASRNSGNL